MANFNFSLDALMGKHINFTVPVETGLFPSFGDDIRHVQHSSGQINGISLIHGEYELLIGDEFYKLKDVCITSINDGNLKRNTDNRSARDGVV